MKKHVVTSGEGIREINTAYFLRKYVQKDGKTITHKGNKIIASN